MEGRNKTGVFGVAEYVSGKWVKTTRWRKNTQFWHSSTHHCVVLREGGPSDFMLVCGFETSCVLLSCTSFIDFEQYEEKTFTFFLTAQKKERWRRKVYSSLDYNRNKFLDTEITEYSYTYLLHTFHLLLFKTGLI